MVGTVCFPGNNHIGRCRYPDFDVREQEKLAELYYVADFYDFVQFYTNHIVPDRYYLCTISGTCGTWHFCVFIPWNTDHWRQESEGGIKEKISCAVNKAG